MAYDWIHAGKSGDWSGNPSCCLCDCRWQSSTFRKPYDDYCRDFSVCAVICYVLCFKLVRERVPVPANNQKFDLAALGKNLITNRALVGIIVAALLLLLAMLGMQGMAGYVFPNYYRSAGAQSAVSLLSNIAVLVICAPLAGKLAARFGKKELSAAACLIGAVSYLCV